MSDTIRLKDASPLVQSVIALDAHFANLERLGGKLEEIKLKSDTDFEQARKLLAHFAECGEGITEQISNLSKFLSEAQVRASAIVQRVSEKSEVVNERNSEQNIKHEQFRSLTDKVRVLNDAISQLRQPTERELTDADRRSTSTRLLEFDEQLDPLIEEAQSLLKFAQEAKMKTLEQNSDSLAQSLLAVRKKIRSLGIHEPLN